MKNKVIKIILILTIILVLIDQVSKVLVVKYFSEPWGNDFLKVEIINNTGMAFGFNNGNGKNIFITICVLALIINFIKNQLERLDSKTGVSLGFILAGGISNLIDRFFRGGVLDFIKIAKFPIFNFADICITIGWILLVIFLIKYSKK